MSICAVSKVAGTEGMVLTAAIIPGKNFGKRCKMVMFRQKVITIREVMESMAAIGEILVVTEDSTTPSQSQREMLMEDMEEGMEGIIMVGTVDSMVGRDTS